MNTLEITDRDATTSAFRQSRKNIPFFAVAAFALTFVPHWLGTVGLFVTGLGAFLYVVFFLHASLSTFWGSIALVLGPLRTSHEKQFSQRAWVIVGMLVTTVDAVVFGACFFFIGKASHWWGIA